MYAATRCLTGCHLLQTLDRKLSVLEAGTSQAAYSVESELADIEDLLSYANDVLNTGQTPQSAHSTALSVHCVTLENKGHVNGWCMGLKICLHSSQAN